MVEIVEQLDLKAMESVYGTSGSAPFHPALLLSILVYGYATGVFSSRKLENATYDSVAFRFVAANEHPDHARAYIRPTGSICWQGRGLPRRHEFDINKPDGTPRSAWKKDCPPFTKTFLN